MKPTFCFHWFVSLRLYFVSLWPLRAWKLSILFTVKLSMGSTVFWIIYFFGLLGFVLKNSGFKYNASFQSPFFFTFFFLMLFLRWRCSQAFPPLFQKKAPSQRPFLWRTFVYRFLVFQSVYDCVVVCGLQKPNLLTFVMTPTLWWLCLKIFTVTCSESSALFLYLFGFSGRLNILWVLPQMFYTFLVFRVFYVLGTTFIFHFMNIKESIQVLEQEFILTTQW